MFRKIGIFALAIAAVAGGYFLGRGDLGGSGAGDFACPKAGAVVGDDVERKCVPLDGSFKGSAKALVSIVVFSEFQCPFCSRVVPTIDQLLKAYPDKLRVYFKHNPLPFHDKAALASEAALAAGGEGKFWEMHDKLFANQQALDRPALEKYASELGLDVVKFKAALDSHKFKTEVDKDMALAKELNAQGTPNSFINGRQLTGAQPYESFKKIVDDEIARAEKLTAKGTPRGQIYAALMKGDGKGTGAPAAPAQPQPPPRPTVSTELYKVEVGKAPVKGGKEPKVTLIAFSEFQCPFCNRSKGTLDELLKIYKDDIQISFKHYPLPFHDNAMPAALAAEAANQQGKFWEMHDKMFANQQALTRPDLEKYAGELGLDAAKFKAAMDDAKTKAAVEADTKQATQFGVQGTPSFFVNGRAFSGAYPLDSFKMIVDEELKKADAKIQAGTPRAQLYAAIIKEALDKKEIPQQPSRPGEPEAGQAYKVGIAGAPIKGAKDALVTIVEYSDFECPFCSRVEPTMDKVLEEYKGKVRVAWRNIPLSFHQRAMPAAVAAMAAHKQGKFWEMHGKLFANQKALDDASIEGYAKDIPGLSFDKWKADREDKDGALKRAIEAEAAAGNKVGARGTPAFFINGVFLSGARPFEQFKTVIDEQLKKAEELVKKGTPKAKVYDAIMKTAKAELSGGDDGHGHGAEGAADAGPPKKIEVGSSPARGPKNAPLTVVVFSDFECPFCSRVEPSVTELEKTYPGKVRVVWKNFPLAFHSRAKPASEAAMAAGEQGKFWEMHEILFKNQRALDDASLEKYAQELKLDMVKWKAAVSSHKYAAQIDADMKQGSAVGVSGTPATFINGRLISGAQPFEAFKKIAEEEMAKGGGGKLVAKKKVAPAAK